MQLPWMQPLVVSLNAINGFNIIHVMLLYFTFNTTNPYSQLVLLLTLLTICGMIVITTPAMFQFWAAAAVLLMIQTMVMFMMVVICFNEFLHNLLMMFTCEKKNVMSQMKKLPDVFTKFSSASVILTLWQTFSSSATLIIFIIVKMHTQGAVIMSFVAIGPAPLTAPVQLKVRQQFHV